jgi:ketosteroid isomerase-like protein
MSQENVEVVRRAYERMNEGDAEGLAALCDEKFVMDMSERVFNPDTYQGREGIARFLKDVREAWESYQWKVEDALVAGDLVVAMVHCEGRSRMGGPDVEWRVAWIWKIKDERALSLRFYRNRAEALEAAGLTE